MLDIKPWRIILVVLVCAAGILFMVPNFFGKVDLQNNYPSWLPREQVSLGLDLQGGSHLLLQVEIESLIEEKIERLIPTVRTELRRSDIRSLNWRIDNNEVIFKLANVANIDRVESLLESLLTEHNIDLTEEAFVKISFTEDALRELRIATLNQSIEIIRRRIDETGVREPTVVRQGTDRVLVQLPGIDDPERMKELIGKTARLTFHLVDHRVSSDDIIRNKIPPGTKVMQLERGDDFEQEEQSKELIAIRKKVELSGDELVEALASFQDNQPVVSFRFDTSGSRKFGEITTENVNRSFAIVLDDSVISAPNINEPILGGAGVISGNFSVQSANDLALLLSAGALPAPMRVLEERTVGPGLGADSIRAGTIACIIGLIAVIIFMVFYYGFFGLIADLALILNLVIIIGVLSLLQATLTLPGIAGIVLTIGMAVDANVLIFERIREESRSGRTTFSAMEFGYKQAFRTIIDSNLTTLIAAIILYLIGSGPVKGFAVTLGIGIVTSMFTAMIVSRYLLILWLRKRRPNALPL